MCVSPIYIKGKGQLPCGKCIDCRKRRTDDWVRRCMCELKSHNASCFLTLTYDNEHLPDDGKVSKRDIQLFLKLLRRHLNCKIRYVCSGEYGEKRGRPHYHLIVFGFCPDDLLFLKKDEYGYPLYTSPFLRSLWNRGHILVGEVTAASCKYVCGYLLKCIDGFFLCSRKPGIGFSSYNFNNAFADKLYLKSGIYPIPRYFEKLFKQDCENFGFFSLYDDFKFRRKRKSDLYISDGFEFEKKVFEKRKKYLRFFPKSLDKSFRLWYTDGVKKIKGGDLNEKEVVKEKVKVSFSQDGSDICS